MHMLLIIIFCPNYYTFVRSGNNKRESSISLVKWQKNQQLRIAFVWNEVWWFNLALPFRSSGKCWSVSYSQPSLSLRSFEILWARSRKSNTEKNQMCLVFKEFNQTCKRSRVCPPWSSHTGPRHKAQARRLLPVLIWMRSGLRSILVTVGEANSLPQV